MILKDGKWVLEPGEEVASDDIELVGGQWVPVGTQQGTPVPGIIRDMPETRTGGTPLGEGLAGATLQGATAGWSDEILAAPMAVAAQVTGAAPKDESVVETYSRMKNSLRERQREFEEGYPGTATAAKVVGGAAGLGKLGAGATAARTAGLGAGYGALEYAGALDDFSDAQLTDAAIQVGLSAALPYAMQRTGEGIKQWLAGRPDETARVIKLLTETTGATPKQLRARAAEMGPESSLVDITGDTGIGFAQGARARGDIGVESVMERNLHKINAAKDRIRATMQSISGKKEGQFFESLDALKENRRANAEIMYGKALDEGTVVPTNRMLKIFDTNPTVRDAWRTVQQKYDRNGLPLPKLFDFDAAGKAVWTGDKFPNMRAMQELKWEMDKRLRVLKGSIDAAGKKEYSRAYDDYREFMSDVNRQNPLFRKANAQYAGDSAMIEAQEMGMKHGLGSAKVEEQLQFIDGLSKSERDAYLQGLMSNAYGKLGTSPEHVLGNVNQLSSENSRKVLSKLLGKTKAGRMIKRFKTERRYREVDTAVRRGSQTAPRQLAEKKMEGIAEAVPTEMLAHTPGIAAIGKVVKKLYPKMSSSQITELADIITKPGGVEDALLRMEMIGMSRAEAEGLLSTVLKSTAAVAPAALMQ